MRILVGLPSLSIVDVDSIFKGLIDFKVQKFNSTEQNLDVFSRELREIGGLKNMWFVGVPNWPLAATGTRGLAGPGLPKEELYVPASLGDTLKLGKYDKWRPYPAEQPYSPYMKSMAIRFAKKRMRAFEKVALKEGWERLLYVDHSPASLRHVCFEDSVEVASMIVKRAITVSGQIPISSLVIFSPYGISGMDGFAASAHFDDIKDWNDIRNYLWGGIKPCQKQSRFSRQ